MRRHVLVSGLPPLALFATALAVRLNQHHAALLYPDGYQYLLMARGISEHLAPTTVLGPGGDGFAPSADAGVKPLYPVLVAGVHMLGFSWLDAAFVVTAVAGALAVVALGMLVAKLSGSWFAGLAAGLLLLASPSVAFWSGFSGPDPLAQALVLAGALAFVYRRPRVGGVFAGLAISTRPELALVAMAAAAVALRGEEGRRHLARATPAAIVTASVVFVVFRAPITIPDGRILWLMPLLLGVVALVTIAPNMLLRYAAVLGSAVVMFALITQPGPLEVWRGDWPLLVVGGAGFVLLIRDNHRSALAVVVIGVVLLLGSVYLAKNPALGRYFSLLLPAAALLAGVGAASLPRSARPFALAALACAVVIGFLSPIPGSRDYDMFSVVARHVGPRLNSSPLVTAAPDAYGFWLPGHTVRGMRPGSRGAVLLDAAQRLYEPGLTANGEVVARVGGEIAFADPNGEIDAGPAVLVVGRVVDADRHRRSRISSSAVRARAQEPSP